MSSASSRWSAPSPIRVEQALHSRCTRAGHVDLREHRERLGELETVACGLQRRDRRTRRRDRRFTLAKHSEDRGIATAASRPAHDHRQPLASTPKLRCLHRAPGRTVEHEQLGGISLEQRRSLGGWAPAGEPKCPFVVRHGLAVHAQRRRSPCGDGSEAKDSGWITTSSA